MILDPGTTHPGVLFCAVPPFHISRHPCYVVYDEITDKLDATQIAKVIANKLGGRRPNRAIIDWK
ncbi:hypothetical protein, partial [Burkholderia cepacia]|uniref:hypothetical protein n=1 Tax=Burkholderia cepacia TaxID=292 RepID=UPI001C37BDC7